MMSVGLHCRIVGRPGRAAALAEFMDFAKTYGKDVWICTREDIARHWHEHHFPRGAGTPTKPPEAVKPKPIHHPRQATVEEKEEEENE